MVPTGYKSADVTAKSCANQQICTHVITNACSFPREEVGGSEKSRLMWFWWSVMGRARLTMWMAAHTGYCCTMAATKAPKVSGRG